jgi:hypothetical protein
MEYPSAIYSRYPPDPRIAHFRHSANAVVETSVLAEVHRYESILTNTVNTDWVHFEEIRQPGGAPTC